MTVCTLRAAVLRSNLRTVRSNVFARLRGRVLFSTQMENRNGNHKKNGLDRLAQPTASLATDHYRYISNPDAHFLQSEAYRKEIEALGLYDTSAEERDLRVCLCSSMSCSFFFRYGLNELLV